MMRAMRGNLRSELSFASFHATGTNIMNLAKAFVLSIVVFCIAGVSEARPDEAKLSSLVKAGHIEQARSILQRSNPRDADFTFFEALIARHAGEFDKAERLLRDTLALSAEHMNARRELAHVLFVKKNYRSSARAFKLLHNVEPDPKMKALYGTYLRAISNQQPFGIFGHFAFLPSTNVNRGTNDLVYDSVIGDFVIDPASRASSGVGIQLGTSGFLRDAGTKTSRNTITWNLIGNKYKASSFDSAVGVLRFTHLHRLSNRTELAVTPNVRYTWRNNSSNQRAVGVSFSVRQKLSARDSLRFVAQTEYRNYFEQAHNSGRYSGAELGYIRQLSHALSYTLGLSLNAGSPNSAHARFRDLAVSIGYNNRWNSGLITRFRAEVGTKIFESDFPLAGKEREDSYYGLSVSLQNNDWNVLGFTPSLTCSYSSNKSNIAFFQHKVTECNLGISKSF
ncbi:surface lipoprotein assembly modifier [Planktotalea sp.]|uniref:surface lipoprotein assembly modifier n=1 Tax=Planktotalea sp. TaxID=2029877 RepID=UPI003297449A